MVESGAIQNIVLEKASLILFNSVGKTHFDLTGRKQGKLTIVKHHHTSDKKMAYWECSCDCGNVTVVSSQSLLRKRNRATKSCGCLRKRTRSERYNWKGVGDMSGEVYHKIRANAAIRKIEFKLSREFLWELFLRQNKKCSITGIDLKFPTSDKIADGTASLDRIDNDRDYDHDNVQWIHKDVNIMKRHHSQTYFIDLCKIIAKANP